MKTKKIILGLLSVSVFTMTAVTSLAGDANNRIIPIEDAVLDQQPLPADNDLEIMPISVDIDAEKFLFGSFTGIVKMIEPSEFVEGLTKVYLESENGQEATAIISEETYILDEDEITEGSKITCYYDALAPMIMIYPPQYSAEVIVVNREDRNVSVDVFDEDLLNTDQSLKLVLSDETEIVTQDGEEFEGELDGRKLIVLYEVLRESMPAQTTPTKIIVLDEKEGSGSSGPEIEDRRVLLTYQAENMSLLIDGTDITGHPAYVSPYKDDNDGLMVPVRAIAEILGSEVVWDNDIKSVTIDHTISFIIGIDNYQTETGTIELGIAPEIYQDRTFVPLSFFTDVMDITLITDELLIETDFLDTIR